MELGQLTHSTMYIFIKRPVLLSCRSGSTACRRMSVVFEAAFLGRHGLFESAAAIVDL